MSTFLAPPPWSKEKVVRSGQMQAQSTVISFSARFSPLAAVMLNEDSSPNVSSGVIVTEPFPVVLSKERAREISAPLTSVTVPSSPRAETENSRVEETPSDSGYSTTQSSATSMTGVGVSSSTGGFSGKGMFSFSFSGSPPHETRLARTAARAISSDMMVLLIVFLSVLSLGQNSPYKKRNGRIPDSP